MAVFLNRSSFMGYTRNFCDTMFFRPKFCANCGEKIERVEWGPLTSRRFCPVCESEFKGQDLIPRAIVGIGILTGVFGFGSYLKSGSAAENRLAKLQQPVAAAPGVAASNVSSDTVKATNSEPQPKTVAALPTADRASKTKPEMQEPQYFCGAETKKGTPCSRRVKGNVRCYQHLGMAAMLPAEKLRIN